MGLEAIDAKGKGLTRRPKGKGRIVGGPGGTGTLAEEGVGGGTAFE
jgi:hypothetical protein